MHDMYMLMRITWKRAPPRIPRNNGRAPGRFQSPDKQAAWPLGATDAHALTRQDASIRHNAQIRGSAYTIDWKLLGIWNCMLKGCRMVV